MSADVNLPNIIVSSYGKRRVEWTCATLGRVLEQLRQERRDTSTADTDVAALIAEAEEIKASATNCISRKETD